MGENLDNLGDSNGILEQAPKGTTHERIEKLNLIKIKNICSSKDNIKRRKTSHRLGENI
jgi:hypothetical protein